MTEETPTGRAIRLIQEEAAAGERARLMVRFQQHYWDSLHKDKELIMQHIYAVMDG